MGRVRLLLGEDGMGSYVPYHYLGVIYSLAEEKATIRFLCVRFHIRRALGAEAGEPGPIRSPS